MRKIETPPAVFVSIKMRTANYGKIKEFKNQGGHGPIIIPIHFTEKDRWICHRFASPPMGNGNCGSEIIVLVDNFGETYHFSEQDSGNGYTMTLTSYNNDMSVISGNYRIYDGCRCVSHKKLDFPITDDCIDIIKASPGTSLIGARENTFKKIDDYIKIIVEKNKKDSVLFSKSELNLIEMKRHTDNLGYKIMGLSKEILELNNDIEKSKTIIKQVMDENRELKNTVENLESIMNNNEIQKRKQFNEYYEQGDSEVTADSEFNSIYMYPYNENESSKYDGYEVYGSWDVWNNPYELISWDFDNIKSWIIMLPEKYVEEYGKKYYYKLKKDGVWIEPSEDELRMKDKMGHWNNVIFIQFMGRKD